MGPPPVPVLSVHRIRKGLDVPVPGAPDQRIEPGPEIRRVALVGDDFHGLKPRVHVEVGQTVRRGQLLCEDRGIPGVRHVAPGAGIVEAIHRGPRRSLRSIVIALSEGERHGEPADEELEAFSPPAGPDPASWARDALRDLLVRSGMWPVFRTRPFSKVPRPDSVPAAIFVTAMDTNPLAADPEIVLAGRVDDFDLGLAAVARLSGGATYLCVREGSSAGGRVRAPVRVEAFAGPHPAGTPGVHIHLLEPAGRNRTVWTIGYQDVLSIGGLLRTGRLDVNRVVALGGPTVRRPRLLRTRLGCSVEDVRDAEKVEEPVRWISGSVLSGKAAFGPEFGYMGRFDLQLSVLPEGGGREFLAWLAPGTQRFSALPAFWSSVSRPASMRFSTATQGSPRAILPLGAFERVVPMDVLPTFLLRALAVEDLERAEELGALELDEEDLALCGFVDPGKGEFGPMLRRCLEAIERDG